MHPSFFPSQRLGTMLLPPALLVPEPQSPTDSTPPNIHWVLGPFPLEASSVPTCGYCGSADIFVHFLKLFSSYRRIAIDRSATAYLSIVFDPYHTLAQKTKGGILSEQFQLQTKPKQRGLIPIDFQWDLNKIHEIVAVLPKYSKGVLSVPSKSLRSGTHEHCARVKRVTFKPSVHNFAFENRTCKRNFKKERKEIACRNVHSQAQQSQLSRKCGDF